MQSTAESADRCGESECALSEFPHKISKGIVFTFHDLLKMAAKVLVMPSTWNLRIIQSQVFHENRPAGKPPKRLTCLISVCLDS